MKEYKHMTAEEQTKWLALFSEFLEKDYADIKAMNEGWQAAFERGLKVLEPMTICQRFVHDSRQIHDYERRIRRMGYFVEELRRQVLATDGELLILSTEQPAKRRVGRPTRDETRRMRREQMLKDSGKVDLISSIAGIKHNSKEEEKPAQQTIDLFSHGPKATAPAPAKTEPTPAPTAQPAGERAYRLQDIKHLLSGELQVDVDRMAVLRQEAAMESEKAKEAALAGKPQDEVATHAQRASELTSEIESIYKAIDEDLAHTYIQARLNNNLDNKEQILKQTEYYYQKVTTANPAFEGLYLSRLTAQKEQEEREKKQGMTDKELKKLLKGYRDYFLRKDVKPSEARLQKMEEKIAHMKQLNVSVQEFEIIYQTEKEAVEAERNEAE